MAKVNVTSIVTSLNSQFTDAKFWTAADSMQRLRELILFVESGFLFAKFSQALYRWLSNCFMHIAHYNRLGFYEEWFADTASRQRWLSHVLRARIVGDAQYCRTEWERAVQRYIQALAGEPRLAKLVNTPCDKTVYV